MEAYTDGACLGNPGAGGWAYLIRDGENITRFGRETYTTNNRMEMQAVIELLVDFQKQYRNRPLTIYTDSMYVLKGITVWSPKWQKNNWRKANSTPVRNVDLWKTIADLMHSGITIVHVKGHSGNWYNNEVDRLASAAAHSVRVK